MIEIDVSADVEDAKRSLLAYERDVIPRALNRAVNTTQRNMITAVNRYLAKETGLKIEDLKSVQFKIPSTWRTYSAYLFVRKRPYNTRRFITRRSRLRVGGFANQLGVEASPWRQKRVFPGTFIIRGRTHGELIVVKRSSRTRSGISGHYGPSAMNEIQRPGAKRVIVDTVRERFALNFRRDLAYYASRYRK